MANGDTSLLDFGSGTSLDSGVITSDPTSDPSGGGGFFSGGDLGSLVSNLGGFAGLGNDLTSSVVPTSGGGMTGSPIGLPAIVNKGASRFPLLYGALQIWRSRGVRLTVEKLWSMARRFGPQFLVSAGILSLGALTELMLAHGTKKRRRMNTLNPHALQRSVRRLAGFQRRAAKVNALLGHVAKRRGYKRGRCMTCRKSPCCC